LGIHAGRVTESRCRNNGGHCANWHGEYANRLKEIDAMVNRNDVFQSAMSQIYSREQELFSELNIAQNLGQNDKIESIRKQLDDLQKDRQEIQKQKNLTPDLTKELADIERENARIKMLQAKYGDAMKDNVDAYEQHKKMITQLNDGSCASEIGTLERIFFVNGCAIFAVT
jgi:DNA repair ATPase RecN